MKAACSGHRRHAGLPVLADPCGCGNGSRVDRPGRLRFRLDCGEPSALAERGFREVTLWTAEWNSSRGFYEAAGWALDGASRETTFAGGHFTEVRYRTRVRASVVD